MSHAIGFPGKSLITIFINGARTSQTYDPSFIDFPFFIYASYFGDFQTLSLVIYQLISNVKKLTIF